MKPLDLRLERYPVGRWKAGRGVSCEEAMRAELEAEKVGRLFGDEASLEAECRLARQLAKTAPPEEQEQDEEQSA